MDRRLGVTIARAIVVLGGVLLAALGVVTLVSTPAIFTGLFLIGLGAVMIGGALMERMRYRSATAELSAAPAGPGGGEPVDRAMESRFQRTDERFVDPTTGTRMRVWIDPSSGERRYRAEE